MKYDHFEISIDKRIAEITLNRPEKRNSMGVSFWHDLPEAINELDKTGKIRAVILASTGPHFSAGLDLQEFAGLLQGTTTQTDAHIAATQGLDFLNNARQMQDTFSALEKMRVPVLCAIQGGCIGAGLDLATACDMRYCTQEAYFTIYEINIGMTADVGTFPRILNHLPEGIVREMAYTGRKMSAQEALQSGLVNKIVNSHEELLKYTREMALDIATKAPMAVHGCKNIITYARDHNTQDTLDYIGLWNASMLQGSEIMAAMIAKQNKQTGNFAPLPPLKKLTD